MEGEEKYEDKDRDERGEVNECMMSGSRTSAGARLADDSKESHSDLHLHGRQAPAHHRVEDGGAQEEVCVGDDAENQRHEAGGRMRAYVCVSSEPS